jgi:hypothetical protein
VPSPSELSVSLPGCRASLAPYPVEFPISINLDVDQTQDSFGDPSAEGWISIDAEAELGDGFGGLEDFFGEGDGDFAVTVAG